MADGGGEEEGGEEEGGEKSKSKVGTLRVRQLCEINVVLKCRPDLTQNVSVEGPPVGCPHTS